MHFTGCRHINFPVLLLVCGFSADPEPCTCNAASELHRQPSQHHSSDQASARMPHMLVLRGVDMWG